MKAHEQTAISTILHPPKVWEEFLDDVYSILKACVHYFLSIFLFFHRMIALQKLL